MPHPIRVAVAALSVAALAATGFAAPAPATNKNPPRDGVVARGLDNPRQLSVAGNRIYVAESGRGGAGPCVTGAEGEVCFGLSGAITEIDGKRQQRVVTKLPSLAARDGSNATGPGDVLVRGNDVAILLGLGMTAERRAALGPDGRSLGTIQTGRLGGRLSSAGDLAIYERDHNPDRGEEDTNPAGFVARDAKNWAVADAGANDLVAKGRKGSRTLAVFPADRTATAPNGATIPFQSVPTDVAVGPDGAFYVSELTGFPFPVGASTIWRVVPGKKPVAYATGLTNVTSLEWRGSTLYAVQLADNGLLAGPTGSVRRVVRGATQHPAVASGLFAPYGLAIKGNTAYVTTCSVCAGGGEVRAVSLR